MENNIFSSFDNYIEDIKNIIINNRTQNNEIGRSIKSINFLEDEVDANFQYFKECYSDKQTPEQVIINLRNNDDKLFRKIDNITNKRILDEVEFRYLTDEVISDADTNDLEYEIKDRWDCSMVKKEELSIEELLELLYQKGSYNDYGDPKSVICELLGFYNSFSCTYKEATEALKKFF